MSGHDGIQRRLALSCNTKRYGHRMFPFTPDNMPACVFVWDNARIKLVAVLQQQAPVRAMVPLSSARSKNVGVAPLPARAGRRGDIGPGVPVDARQRLVHPRSHRRYVSCIFMLLQTVAVPVLFFSCAYGSTVHGNRSAMGSRRKIACRPRQGGFRPSHPLSHLHVTTHADSYMTFSYI